MAKIQPWSLSTLTRENDPGPWHESGIWIFSHNFNLGLFIDVSILGCSPHFIPAIFSIYSSSPYRSYIEFRLGPAPESKQISAVQFSSLAWKKALKFVYKTLKAVWTNYCMGSSSFSEFCSWIPGCPMSTPIFAGKGSDISSCLCSISISRSVSGKCIPLWFSTRYVQQIRESRSIFRLEVMELQRNQGGDWLGAAPKIPVIFGAYVYILCRTVKRSSLGSVPLRDRGK